MSNAYNGWTNYATWRVNLEVFDQMTPGDFWGFEDATEEDAYELGKALKEYAEETICELTEERMDVSTIARDYALAFLSDVNWNEIAKHMIKASVEA